MDDHRDLCLSRPWRPAALSGRTSRRRGQAEAIHQERYDEASGRFIGEKGCMKGVRLVPYRLNEWVDDDGLILIAEGERKVDALIKLGWLATCNTGGAEKFSRGFAPYFADRDVVILPDNDQAGRDHARQVAAILEPVAASIRILELPGLQAEGRLIDWLAAGGTADQLRALIKAAPTAADVIADMAARHAEDGAGEPATEVIDNVIRLASLRPVDYDRVRKEEAKRLGVRASTLDAEVEKHRPRCRRGRRTDTEGKGQALDLYRTRALARACRRRRPARRAGRADRAVRRSSRSCRGRRRAVDRACACP